MSEPDTVPKINFIDLLAQRRRLGDRIDRAVMEAVDSGRWVMGPQVAEFERALASYCGATHAVSCANGTDALALPLMAWGLRPGDAVFCPSFTFAATAEVIPWLGAEPVFVDVRDDTFNMDPDHLEAAIEATLAEGRLRPRVVIPVCLFGQAAEYGRIADIARRFDLKLIADSAQGFGSTIDGRHPIDWADVVTTSFFPAKPLGCYGDGGAVLTNDGALAELLDSLRIHGKATASDVAEAAFDHDPKYLNMRIGMNSRLDTIQAAVLLEKLAVFNDEIAWRNAAARRYGEGLADVVHPPVVQEGVTSIWAQYTIRTERRDALAAHLKAKSVPTASYYPVPMHKQAPYARFGSGPGGLPRTEALAEQVLSLPMYPDLDAATQDYIIAAVRSFFER